MKKYLFLLLPLVMGACSHSPLTENECVFACMNEGHSLRRVEANSCLCNMNTKLPKADKEIPQPKEKEVNLGN